MKARVIKQWADHRLDHELFNTFFLNRNDDPAWFRPIEAKNDEAAIAEAERIIAEEGDGPPIDWERQSQFHTKAKGFFMAILVREAMLKHGEEPSSLRELVSLVCRVEWMV